MMSIDNRQPLILRECCHYCCLFKNWWSSPGFSAQQNPVMHGQFVCNISHGLCNLWLLHNLQQTSPQGIYTESYLCTFFYEQFNQRHCWHHKERSYWLFLLIWSRFYNVSTWQCKTNIGFLFGWQYIQFISNLNNKKLTYAVCINASSSVF